MQGNIQKNYGVHRDRYDIISVSKFKLLVNSKALSG